MLMMIGTVHPGDITERAHRGEALAIKVGIDQAVDLKALKRLQLQGVIELHQANELEQRFSQVVQAKKGLMLGHSKLGVTDVLANERIARELERIIGSQNRRDIGHIYAAYLNKCVYFVTNNVRDFINGGLREELEALLHVKIRRTEEFLQEMEETR